MNNNSHAQAHSYINWFWTQIYFIILMYFLDDSNCLHICIYTCKFFFFFLYSCQRAFIEICIIFRIAKFLCNIFSMKKLAIIFSLYLFFYMYINDQPTMVYSPCPPVRWFDCTHASSGRSIGDRAVAQTSLKRKYMNKKKKK